VQKLKDRLNGWVKRHGVPPVGSRAWEAKLEVEKLPHIISDRTERLAKGDLTPKERERLEREVTHLERQLEGYQKDFKAMDKDPGKGFVAVDGDKYDIEYPSAAGKPRGMQMPMEQVRQLYGEHGVTTVERTQQRAQEIIDSGVSKKSRGPVVSGITDPQTGKTHFGQNFTQGEIRDGNLKNFETQLHPILKQRLIAYKQKLGNNLIKVEDPLSISKAGEPGSHSEIRALDQALKAREAHTGQPATEADLSSFLLHNRSLNDPTGVPPRCVNCWHITNGVTVIGND
jgi:hypothetical protein